MACDDRELVLSARSGNRDALAALTAAHGERVLRFLQVMTGDASAADDLAQDSWSTAFTRLDQLESPERFGNWLLAIAVNRCRNWLKREVQRHHLGGDTVGELAAPARSALSSLVRREDAVHLQLAIDRLPILLREAFVLHEVEGLPYQELAVLCEATPNTCQVRVHRAKALLRQQLGPHVATRWR